MIQSETYEERAWKAEAKIKELEAEKKGILKLRAEKGEKIHESWLNAPREKLLDVMEFQAAMTNVLSDAQDKNMARIAELEAERKWLASPAEFKATSEQNKALQARVRELERELKKYAGHTKACSVHHLSYRKICNCGFQKLVDAWTLKGRMGEHSTARFTKALKKY